MKEKREAAELAASQKVVDEKNEELETDIAGLDAAFEQQVEALKEARDTGKASKHAVYDRFMKWHMSSYDQQEGRLKLASQAAVNYEKNTMPSMPSGKRLFTRKMPTLPSGFWCVVTISRLWFALYRRDSTTFLL
jgi:hypothetical protein